MALPLYGIIPTDTTETIGRKTALVVCITAIFWLICAESPYSPHKILDGGNTISPQTNVMSLKKTTSRVCDLTLTLFLCCCLTGCAVKNEDTQKTEQTLTPGLATLYYDKFLRHLDQMPPTTQGRPGAPILQLNHRFEKNEVFSSGLSKGVAIQMTGFILLEKPGVYQFRALANDGISLHIDDQLLFKDPRVHGDRLSPTGTFTAPASGHYPLLIRYFQRKGTATLILYWQQPGQSSFEVVPAAVYFH